MELPPVRWTREDLTGFAAWLGLVLWPWFVIGAVIVGILFAVGVLP